MIPLIRSLRRHRAAASACVLALAVPGCAFTPYVPVTPDAQAVPAAIEAARLGDATHERLLREFDTVAEWPPAVWRVSQLALIAIARSAAVTAARAEVVAAGAAQRFAARGPNPTVSVGVSRNSDLDPGDSSRWSVGPGLEYPWSPVARAPIRGAIAGSAVDAARAAVREAAWQAWHMATSSALELAAARARHAAAQAEADALAAAVALARRQVAAGLSDAYDWQSLKLEANDMRIAHLDALGRISRAGSALAAALALSPAALGDLALAAPEPVTMPPFADLQRAALHAHPSLLRALADYARSEHELELAVAEQYPEITLNPAYLFDQGDNLWSLVGGVVVPLAGYHSEAIAAAAAARDAAARRFAARQSELIADLRTAWSEWEASAAALAASARLATDIAAERATLSREAADGLSTPLLAARAEVQQAALAVTQADLTARQARAAADLAYTARVPLFEPGLARYLDSLVTVPAEAP